MFIVHWFYHEAVLTYQQIRTDVTIPHIFTGVVLYSIVHTAAKNGHRSAKRVEHLFKSEAQRMVHSHVHLRHGGRPWNCKDCEAIIIAEQTL